MNNRFCSYDDVHTLFDLHNVKDDEVEAITTKPSGGWIDGYTSNMDSYLSWANFRRAVFTNPVYQTIMKTMFTVFFLATMVKK